MSTESQCPPSGREVSVFSCAYALQAGPYATVAFGKVSGVLVADRRGGAWMRDLTKRNLTRQQRDRGTGVGEDAGFNMAVIPPFGLAWTGRGRRKKRKHPVSNDVGTAHVHHSNGGEPRLALTAGVNISPGPHCPGLPPLELRGTSGGAQRNHALCCFVLRVDGQKHV